jgi:hypothetical protein
MYKTGAVSGTPTPLNAVSGSFLNAQPVSNLFFRPIVTINPDTRSTASSELSGTVEVPLRVKF